MNDKLETTYGRAFKDISQSVETHKKNGFVPIWRALSTHNFQNQIWVRYEIDRIVWSNRKSKYTIMHISQDQSH